VQLAPGFSDFGTDARSVKRCRALTIPRPLNPTGRPAFGGPAVRLAMGALPT